MKIFNYDNEYAAIYSSSSKILALVDNGVDIDISSYICKIGVNGEFMLLSKDGVCRDIAELVFSQHVHTNGLSWDNTLANLQNDLPCSQVSLHKLGIDVLGIPMVPRYISIDSEGSGDVMIKNHPISTEEIKVPRATFTNVGKFYYLCQTLHHLNSQLSTHDMDKAKNEILVKIVILDHIIAVNNLDINQEWYDSYVQRHLDNIDFICASPYDQTSYCLSMCNEYFKRDPRIVQKNGETIMFKPNAKSPITFAIQDHQVPLVCQYEWGYDVFKGPVIITIDGEITIFDILGLEKPCSIATQPRIDDITYDNIAIFEKNNRLILVDKADEPAVEKLTWDVNANAVYTCIYTSSGLVISSIAKNFPIIPRIMTKRKITLGEFIYHVLHNNPIVPGYKIVPVNGYLEDCRYENLSYISVAKYKTTKPTAIELNGQHVIIPYGCTFVHPTDKEGYNIVINHYLLDTSRYASRRQVRTCRSKYTSVESTFNECIMYMRQIYEDNDKDFPTEYEFYKRQVLIYHHFL